MVRFIAFAILLIPGIIGAFGIKMMRDALFVEVYPFLWNEGLQFFIGLLLFLAGLVFIGGFIYHRDKKRQKIKERKNSNNNT